MDMEFDIRLSITEGRGLDWIQETKDCKLYKCKQYGFYFVVDIQNNIIVPSGRYTYIDKFNNKGFARVNKENKDTNTKLWGIIDYSGKEILPLEYDYVGSFCNDELFRFAEVRKGNIVFMFDTIHCDLYQWNEIEDNNEQYNRDQKHIERRELEKSFKDAFEDDYDNVWNID